jgi:hypothetical protein
MKLVWSSICSYHTSFHFITIKIPKRKWTFSTLVYNNTNDNNNKTTRQTQKSYLTKNNKAVVPFGQNTNLFKNSILMFTRKSVALFCFLFCVTLLGELTYSQTIPDEDWGYVTVRKGAHMFWYLLYQFFLNWNLMRTVIKVDPIQISFLRWLYGMIDKTKRLNAPLVMWYASILKSPQKRKIYLEIFCLGCRADQEHLAQVHLSFYFCHEELLVNIFNSSLTTAWFRFWKFWRNWAFGFSFEPSSIYMDQYVCSSGSNYHRFTLLSWFQNVMILFFSASIIFVDNPVGAGFSYVDDLKLLTVNENQIATDLLTLFKAFLQRYPIFQGLPFYIFSESYGGKVTTIRFVKRLIVWCQIIGTNTHYNQFKFLTLQWMNFKFIRVRKSKFQSVNRIDWDWSV